MTTKEEASKVGTVDVEIVTKWLSGLSLEALALPPAISSDIKTFVNDCRHRKLVSNSVADAPASASPADTVITEKGKEQRVGGGGGGEDTTASVTLKVAQRCANIIRALVEWYINEELTAIGDRSENGSSGSDEDEDDSSDGDASETSSSSGSDSNHIMKKTTPAGELSNSMTTKSDLAALISSLNGSSVHTHLALAALKHCYAPCAAVSSPTSSQSTQKDLSLFTADKVTATQMAYLILLVDKVGSKLASATAFQVVAASVTMRAIAIIKRSIEAPSVCVPVSTVAEAIAKKYGNGEEIAAAVKLIGTPTATAPPQNSQLPYSVPPSRLGHLKAIHHSVAGVVGGLGPRHQSADDHQLGQKMARVDTTADLSLFDDIGDEDLDDEGDDSYEGGTSNSFSPAGGGPFVAQQQHQQQQQGRHTESLGPIRKALSEENLHNDNEECNDGNLNKKAETSSDIAAAVDVEALEHFQEKFSSVQSSVLALTHGKAVNLANFANVCTEELGVFEDSLESMTASMCKHAANHIYENETVLTIGCSHSTLAFFTEAAKTRSFRLIVLESAGSTRQSIQHLSNVLRQTNPNVVIDVLPDSSTYAVMSNCSKVFVACDSILATGGALCPVGTHPICITAKMFSTPVIVVAMTVKLIPWLPLDPQCSSLIRLSKSENHEQPCSLYAMPTTLIPARHILGSVGFGTTSHEASNLGLNVRATDTCGIDVVFNAVEYVPPSLISLVVTDTDEFVAPHIHRHIRELYRIEDSEL